MIEEILKFCSNLFGLSILFPTILVIFIIGLIEFINRGGFDSHDAEKATIQILNVLQIIL